jgi:hypothetical protein
MAGCGGGGGESATLGSVLKPTKAVITVSIPALPTGKLVAGVSFKIHLPAGVTPAVLSGNDAGGSASLTGGAVGSIIGAGYDSTTNIITFGNITTNGFGPGDFLVINTLLNSNTTATPGDFTLSDGSLIDTDGNPIAGVAPTISSVAFK